MRNNVFIIFFLLQLLSCTSSKNIETLDITGLWCIENMIPAKDSPAIIFLALAKGTLSEMPAFSIHNDSIEIIESDNSVSKSSVFVKQIVNRRLNLKLKDGETITIKKWEKRIVLSSGNNKYYLRKCDTNNLKK